MAAARSQNLYRRSMTPTLARRSQGNAGGGGDGGGGSGGSGDGRDTRDEGYEEKRQKESVGEVRG